MAGIIDYWIVSFNFGFAPWLRYSSGLWDISDHDISGPSCIWMAVKRWRRRFLTHPLGIGPFQAKARSAAFGNFKRCIRQRPRRRHRIINPSVQAAASSATRSLERSDSITASGRHRSIDLSAKCQQAAQNPKGRTPHECLFPV